MGKILRWNLLICICTSAKAASKFCSFFTCFCYFPLIVPSSLSTMPELPPTVTATADPSITPPSIISIVLLFLFFNSWNRVSHSRHSSAHTTAHNNNQANDRGSHTRANAADRAHARASRAHHTRANAVERTGRHSRAHAEPRRESDVRAAHTTANGLGCRRRFRAQRPVVDVAHCRHARCLWRRCGLRRLCVVGVSLQE